MTDSLGLMIPEGISEPLVELQRDNRLGQLIEVSSEDVGSIMHSVACPVQAFAISVGAVKCYLELLDTLLASGQPENALDISSYQVKSVYAQHANSL